MGVTIAGKLILASASPRRIELLRLTGLDFEVMPTAVEEIRFAGEGPAEHVCRLSKQKAHAISCRYPDAWVIGADTIVFINNEMLGKPANLFEASDMLKKLSGREHYVYTGYTIMRKAGEVFYGEVATSSVLFKDISEEEINWYVHTEEPYDKAGGYALQGIGAFFIKEIRGSHTNIIGLPLCETLDSLKSLGAIKFSVTENESFYRR